MIDLMADASYRDFIGQFASLMQNTQKVSLDEARKQSTAFFCPPSLPRESVHQITNVKVKGRDGNEIPIRLYNSIHGQKLPVIVYFHRGGWVFSNIEEADPVCRKLANHLKCVVASVDYRLAPENPFPKPLNDCYDALCWVSEHAEEYGGNKEKIIVCGESAGGNLAAATALQARDRGTPSIAAQVLIYPIISSTINREAYENCAEKKFITKDAMQFFWSMYIQNPADAKNPYASPDLANDLKKLPPAIVITAEHDPLHEEGESYGEKMRKAGVDVTVERFPGVIHGFLDLPVYKNEEIISWIKKIGTLLSKFTGST